MPSTIRLRVDRSSADLAVQRLSEEGITAQVIADSDMLGVAGTPMHFSLVVPAHLVDRARKVLSHVDRGAPRRRS